MLHNIQVIAVTKSLVSFTVKDYALKYGMFDYGLWVGTIVMAALGIAWGLIAFGFGCFNVLSHPIETITGPVGLYVWNAIAGKYTLHKQVAATAF